MPKGIDGTEYDESWDSDDDSLESFIRSWVEVASASPTIELAHSPMKRFPVLVADAIEIIHTMVEVPAWTKDGNKRDRPPSRPEIKIGMVKCGLHHLTKDHPAVPSRTERLLSGDVISTVKRTLDLTKGRIAPLNATQWFDCRIPRDTSEMIQDFADSLSLSTSSMRVACYVAGLANSREWMVQSHVFRGDWVSQCQSAIEWFWQLIGSNWGLL